MKSLESQILLSIISISLVILSYYGVLQLGFANVDDQWQVLDDDLIGARRFGFEYLFEVFTNINSLQYSPLNTLYCNLIHRINGYDPMWFHILSVFIHIINGVLTYFLGKKLLTLFDISNSQIIAFAVSLVWVLLPMNIESVVWIAASKIVLFSFFGLLSFFAFLNYYISRSTSSLIGSLILLIFSFLCKEQAVLFPLTYFAFVYCYEAKKGKTSFLSTLKLVVPWFVLAFIFGIVTLYVVIFGAGTHDVIHYPFSQRFILFFYCVYFYVTKLFIPFNLHYHYPFPMGDKQPIPVVYYIYPPIVIIFFWHLVHRIKNADNFYFYMFCLTIFFTHLLLILQVVPLARAAMVADRYIYLSAPGLLMLFFTVMFQHQDFGKVNLKGLLTVLAFATYLIVFVTYNQQLVANWIPNNIKY